ncbi:MAG: choice-of-anchor A family protein [Micrococcales bacterium]|nr:choice-of-anchor A family protein [Micrococcales bacterium]
MVAVAGVSAVVVGLATLPTAADESDPACPDPGDMPGVDSVTNFFHDANVAVWIGGNFTANPRFAETEGLNVIQGDLTVQNGGLLNIGVVGVGSGIVPPMDSVMLAVGGNVTVAPGSSAIVGGLSITGRADIAGTLSGDLKATRPGTNPGDPPVESADGIRTGFTAAVDPWASFGSDLIGTSDQLAALTPTGTYSGGTFTVTQPDALMQVFTITAQDLVDGYGSAIFANLPTGPDGATVPVVINVTGTTVTMEQNYVEINGTRVDNLSAGSLFGDAAAALLWNFPDATTVNILGSSQTMGSIVAPRATTTTVTASTNGRFYVAGDVTRAGDGAEHHNFPWHDSVGFGCIADLTVLMPATFEIVKEVVGDAADQVPPTTAFTVAFTVSDPDGDPVTTDIHGNGLPTTLTLLADGTVVDGPQLQHGDRVTFTEVTPPAVPGVAWGDVEIDPSTLVLDATVPIVRVTVTNSADIPGATTAPFKVVKKLTGAPDLVGLVPASTTFTMTYTVVDADGDPVTTDADGTPLTGTLTVRADGTATLGPTLHDGDRVTLLEATPPPISDIAWGNVSVTPSTLVIAADGPVATIEVDNQVLAIPDHDPDLPGSFTISKDVVGPQAGSVPPGTEFAVSYVVNDADGDPVTTDFDGAPLPQPQTLTITADGSPVAGPALRTGDRVTFSEAAPPAIPGIVWGGTTITPTTVTVWGGSSSEVVVENLADAPDVSAVAFAAVKYLTGAAAGSVGDDTVFRLDYTVVDVHDKPVTTDADGAPLPGFLIVGADGAVVDGPRLRHLDRITFTEALPPPVPGVTWGNAQISPTTLVMNAESPQTVVVTNTADPTDTLDIDPQPTPTPSATQTEQEPELAPGTDQGGAPRQSAGPSGRSLPTTGASTGTAWAAGMLTLIGVMLAAVAYRRSRIL